MNFKDKDKLDRLSDMLGLTEDRTKELETKLSGILLSSAAMSIADATEKIAPELKTPEECYYAGYIIGATTHDASA